MDKLVIRGHPGEGHFLSLEEKSLPSSQLCSKCTKPVSGAYYKCTRVRQGSCEYFLHKDCAELKDLPQEYHPLHPQHPLAMHFDLPHISFVCSFCKETKQSKHFYKCSEEQCDFYLDSTCEHSFADRPKLLDKYKIQHVFHDHENHHLSPHKPSLHSFNKHPRCGGCDGPIVPGFRGFKCTGCSFYLDAECSQVPKEVQHHTHPQHPLVLLQNHQESKQQVHLSCISCLKQINNEFYLHCTHCPTFNLDLKCYFLSKYTVKHEAHEHPLAYYKIYDNDARCYACNTSLKHLSFFRCFTCDFNIHYDCFSFPLTVDYDDHIHPLTLTTSFKEESFSNTYYCDICETRRDPDRGVYVCKECPFIAHFECALSLSPTEVRKYRYAPWCQKVVIDSHIRIPHAEQKDKIKILTNKKETLEIFDQLNVKIEKLREVIDQLIINERDGEQLKEKIQEFEEAHTKTEEMLRQLKGSVIKYI